MKKLPTFEHFCLDCKNQFIEVALFDFSYGEILRWSKLNRYVLLDVLDDEIFSDIKSIFSLVYKNKFTSPLNLSESIIDFYFQLASEELNFDEPYHYNNSLCPKCKSTNIEISGEKNMGYIAFEIVKHNKWQTMTFDAKKLIAEQFLKNRKSIRE